MDGYFVSTDKVDPKIRGTGQKNAFQFTVDSGGSIMVSAYLQKESGVVREFLPPGKIQTKGGQVRLFDVLLSQSNYFTDAHEQEVGFFRKNLSGIEEQLLKN